MLIVGNLALKQVGIQSVSFNNSFDFIFNHFYAPVTMHNYNEVYQDILCFNTLTLQLQATVLGLLASLMATVLGWMAEGKMPLHHVVLLCSTSVSTAFMASLLQSKNSCCHFQPIPFNRIKQVNHKSSLQVHQSKPTWVLLFSTQL